MAIASADQARRERMAERLPWVTRITQRDIPCDGIKWGTVALRDLYPFGTGERTPPRGIQPRSRCSLRAKWHFRALGEKSAAFTPRRSWRERSGNYCWHHLVSEGVQGSMEESERAEKWLRAHPEKGEG